MAIPPSDGFQDLWSLAKARVWRVHEKFRVGRAANAWTACEARVASAFSTARVKAGKIEKATAKIQFFMEKYAVLLPRIQSIADGPEEMTEMQFQWYRDGSRS